MSTQSPSLFPTGGLRPLSTREALQRSQALACTVPTNTRPSCSGQVFVGLFFDGTGNNLELDYNQPAPDKRKHSNVVRLYQTFRDEHTAGYLRFYLPGVGTPFPEIGDSGGKLGKAMAARGEDRIHWAFTRLVNAPHRFVHDAALIDDANSKVAVGQLSSGTARFRRNTLRNWQDKLKAALKDQKPTVTQINLSVFGFSRGAAQARAFVNWLFDACEHKDGAWQFAGIPLRLQFLGIFDTVASVGLADLLNTGVVAGHQSWADDNLQIHPAVEQCVHYVAAHEVRACFPLDSVRVKNSYPANAKEVMYPGAHSDVGGGYPAKALGVGSHATDLISIVPGAQMYEEARVAGVPLLPLQQLRRDFVEALTPSVNAIEAFNGYARRVNRGAAPVKVMHEHHWAHYAAWRQRMRAKWQSSSPMVNATEKERAALAKTQADLLKRLSLGMEDPGDPQFDPTRAVQLSRSMHRAAGLKPSASEESVYALVDALAAIPECPEADLLFSKYVHDSMAGFVLDGVDEYEFNRLGIGKYRTIFHGDD
jgi:hypothetical protein